MTETTLRVLVTGSRSWDDRAAVWTALDRMAVDHPDRRIVVVHGDASGADKLAAELGGQRRGRG